MILGVYAVRDGKTDQFANPMYLINKAHAIRSFGDEINRKDENNMLFTHPEDFELFELGTYNTETGLFNTGQPKSVVQALELLDAKKHSAQHELPMR